MGSSTATKITERNKSNMIDAILRFLLIIVLLYLFLVGVKLLGGSFKMMGGGFAQGLLNVSASPIAGLFAGMFATVLIQSSSVTTSIIVGLVSSGTLPMSGAVPMIMGANLGTSVTNTLVSLGYIKNQKHFRDAFAAATIHDFFNILTVIILLPLEIMTGFLEKAATNMASILYGTSEAMKFKSPVKAVIKPVAKGVKVFITDTLGHPGSIGGIIMAIIAAAIIIFSLGMIVKTMKVLVESNKGEIIEKLLAKNGYIAILFGIVLTISVQSSSITTSLLVPMAGSGVLTLRSILPVTIGANIGTTATALLASLTGNVSGLAIALVHFLFNMAGMLIWYVPSKMRNIPIILCQKLADLTLKNRMFGLGYVLIVFFVLPFLLTVTV